MPVANYVKDWDKHTSLSYLDFLEVIARISDYLSLPSYEQIREAEYDNILEMFKCVRPAPRPRRIAASPSHRTSLRCGR